MTNIEDARLTMYQHSVNNISLHDIEHASQSNNKISFIDKLRNQLNDAERKKQSLDLEVKLRQIIETFSKASDTVKTALLKDIDLELNILNKASISTTQDPPEFKRRKMHRKGESRKLTAAEIAEKELKKSDRQAKELANLEVIDLTGPKNTPQTISDTIIVAPMPVDDPEIVVLNTWLSNESDAQYNGIISQIRRSKRSSENSPQNSPLRLTRRRHV